MNRGILGGAALAVFALAIGGWIAVRPTFQQAHASIEEKPKAPSVFVSKTVATELFDQLTYPARVTAKVNTTLLAETEGVVSSISLGLGRPVTKGQTILTVTHTDPVYQYAPARVVSPVSGIVSSLEISEGTQVSRGQKIGTVTDPTKLRLTVEVPAQDLSAVHKGLNGELRLAGVNDPLAVRVTGVSPFVDPASGTAPCEIDLSSEASTKFRHLLAPGRVGQVSFKARTRQGITLPDHAITYKGPDPSSGSLKEINPSAWQSPWGLSNEEWWKS